MERVDIVSRELVRSSSMPDRHMMIDLETLDTIPTAGIVSIGAVTFNPRGDGVENEDTFSITIDRDSNKAHGRTESLSTLEWWDAQEDEAKRKVFGGPHTELSTAMRRFTTWINERSPTCTRVWAKDPDFDVVILNDACRRLELIWPFMFWESRSVRTVMEMAYPEGDFPTIGTDGPKHDAITDAKEQAIAVQHAFYVLGC